MDPQHRIVTCTPVTELWNSSGTLDADHLREVGETDILELLRDGSSFVVAEVGKPLRWISKSDRFIFWKSEVRYRLVAPGANGFYLDDYPNHYCYSASLWQCAPSIKVIVLEKHH